MLIIGSGQRNLSPHTYPLILSIMRKPWRQLGAPQTLTLMYVRVIRCESGSINALEMISPVISAPSPLEDYRDLNNILSLYPKADR